MALPYPEGEVFFKRSVLKDNGGGLDPDNQTSFNSHALVEWCWNDTPKSGSSDRNHLNYCPGKFEKDKKFYYYQYMNIMFGTKEGFEKEVASPDRRHLSRHSGIKRQIRTILPGTTEEYEKRARGGPLMTAITPIKLEPDQPYMYIDLCFPIRAIYFPLSQKPTTVFPDLCSYLMVDFRLRQGIEMYDSVKHHGNKNFPSEIPADLDPHSRRVLEEAMLMMGMQEGGPSRSRPMEFDLQAGLGNNPDLMISLYIPGIYNYLILPRQMRSVERGLYKPTDPTKSLIRVHNRKAILTTSKYLNITTIDQDLSLNLDMTKILQGHLGVQVVWQPFDIPEPEDANKLLVDAVEMGLCFIPVVGPLASLCFTVFVEIVKNPEAFKEVNPFDLSGNLLANAAAAAEAIAEGFPKPGNKAAKISKFLSVAGTAASKLSKPQ